LGRRRIPASLHYVGDHPHVDFGALGLAVAERLTEWPRAGRPGRAGVSAFGFGGTNAHVIVEEAPAALATFAAPATGAALATGPAPAAEALAPSARIGHYFIGGADVPRLRESAAGLADWLEGEGEGEVAALPDVERTLTRRLCGRARAGVVARDRPSLLAGLRACAAGTSAAGLVERDAGRRDSGPVWVFSGQGSQWPGMALRLLGEEPAFAAALRELDELIAPAAGFSVCEELERREELTAMARLQPVLFAVQVALARLLTAYGVKPAAVVGHSLGEVAAAVTAGALSTADGVRVVTLRSRLLATLAGSGSMALLELSAEELERLLGDGVGVGADGRPGVAVAAFNAPGQIAVAGTAPEVEAVVAAVEARGLLAKLIKSTVPGHCMLVDPVVEDLRAGLAGLAPREPHIPFYGTVLDDARAAPGFGASYWAANIRRPVRFAQAVAAAVADGHASFVEVSPHPVLSHALIDNVHTAGVAQPVVLATGRRSDDECLAFHAGLAALAIEGGVPAELAPPGGRVIDVPRTRWRHAPHWLEAPAPRTSVRAHPLLGERVDLPDPGRRVWRAELDPGLAAGERWMALSTWLEIARCAAGEALPGRDAEVEIGGLVVHAPLALGDRCTVVTTVELTAPRSARLSVQSRIGAGAWRLHVSATVETIPAGGAGAPAPLDAPLHLLLAAQDSPHDFIGNALESLTGALGPVGEGAWLPRSVGRVRWRGDLDAVSSAQMSLGEATAGPERTAALRLLDAHGQVIVDLGEVTFALASRAELPVALSEALLTLDWQPAPAPRATAAGGGTWIVVAADGADPRAQELAAELGARGALAAVVGADGAGEALSAEGPLDGVVVLAGTGGRDGGGRPDDAVSLPDDVPGRRDDVPARGQELLLLGARVVQALTERPGAGAASPAHLWFVTAGAAAVAGGVLSDPGPAALRGLVRVLAYEHPELEPRWVDLDPQRGIEGLISELGAADDEDEVAWRSGRRHVARLGRPELRETGAQSTVHPDGAYLVTGGLGGLGLVLARWLAERGAARVVLNGRSAPDAHAQEELAGLGCEVVVVTGDITQAGVAERAVAACDAPGAHFRGVIHAAAVIEDRVALRLDRESVERVWRAKAHGAWRLSAACEGFELDWWIGFSSAAALIG
ncbi:MAG TPA: SDR family NAD(P)-dependent oxidoreductase, partial [Solirubrobacteraceae bacterium]|nr:SDR family NAD(P)-dependent oxidoreductase [Solirubrobacteraceae bacterium]